MEWKDPEKEVSIYMTIKYTEIRFESGTESKFYCFCYGQGETFRFEKNATLIILSLIYVFNIWNGNYSKSRKGHTLP